MRSATYDLSISTTRADALFASALQRSDEPSVAQIDQAIAAAVRAFGARGCAARVAQAYGDHPETAAARDRYVRRGQSRASALPCPRWSARRTPPLSRSLTTCAMRLSGQRLGARRSGHPRADPVRAERSQRDRQR
jgi:hypothetical protein